ncbi:MAG: N-acetyltransferase family protein [Acidimicrobiales bacterium]
MRDAGNLEEQAPPVPSTSVGLPPGYPSDLEGTEVLDDGTVVAVRPICPADADALGAFHLGLSSNSVRLRFFGAHPRLSPAEIKRFTCVDYRDRLALVAEVQGRLTGVARYDRRGDDEAEVAFVVADEYQHHGIGTRLLERLAEAARQRGITSFFAETLAENRRMLDVFFHSGYAVTADGDGELVDIRFPIVPPAAPPPPEGGPAPC